jgi:hypothetical protein
VCHKAATAFVVNDAATDNRGGSHKCNWVGLEEYVTGREDRVRRVSVVGGGKWKASTGSPKKMAQITRKSVVVAIVIVVDRNHLPLLNTSKHCGRYRNGIIDLLWRQIRYRKKTPKQRGRKHGDIAVQT